MAAQAESSTLLFIRSLAAGVLASMLFAYAVHVWGTWTVENYRPDDQTTYTVLLHNRCAVFGGKHTLRPNADLSNMGSGIDGTKLGASFLLFSEGHILAMLMIALLVGVVIFAFRKRARKTSL